jgi:hypothetical protein
LSDSLFAFRQISLKHGDRSRETQELFQYRIQLHGQRRGPQGVDFCDNLLSRFLHSVRVAISSTFGNRNRRLWLTTSLWQSRIALLEACPGESASCRLSLIPLPRARV